MKVALLLNPYGTVLQHEIHHYPEQPAATADL